MLERGSPSPEDAGLLQRCIARLPWHAWFPSALALYEALLLLAPHLPWEGEAGGERVAERVLQTALESALLVRAGEPGHAGGSGAASAGGDGGGEFVVSIHRCVEAVLEQAPADATPESMLRAMAAPLLLLHLFLATHARRLRGGEGEGGGVEGEGGGSGLAKLAGQACGWAVEMPQDLEEPIEEGEASPAAAADAVSLGWACWLNAAAGVRCAGLAMEAPGGEGGTSPVPEAVLGRLQAAMQCLERLDALAAFLERCRRAFPAVGGPALDALLAVRGGRGAGAAVAAEAPLLAQALTALQPHKSNCRAVACMLRLLCAELTLRSDMPGSGAEQGGRWAPLGGSGLAGGPEPPWCAPRPARRRSQRCAPCRAAPVPLTPACARARAASSRAA